MMIKFTKVQKQYSDGNECLNDINLKIDQGEFVFLVGHSGAGKSSLLKLITREEKITDGRIIVDKENITNINKYGYYEMRAKILKDKVSALNEAERKGIEKGIEEGRKEGIKEGIEKSRLKDVETVLKLLNKKFANVSKEFNDKIQNLNGDKLNLIIENILDIDTLDQLRQYL